MAGCEQLLFCKPLVFWLSMSCSKVFEVTQGVVVAVAYGSFIRPSNLTPSFSSS